MCMGPSSTLPWTNTVLSSCISYKIVISLSVYGECTSLTLMVKNSGALLIFSKMKKRAAARSPSWLRQLQLTFQAVPLLLMLMVDLRVLVANFSQGWFANEAM